VLTIEEIQERTAAHYGITLDELRSKRRFQHMVWPRHVVCYLARQKLRLSYPAIGKKLGVHHSNVMWSVNVVCDRLFTDPIEKSTFDRLNRTLR
jgi:chromosomal replication initiator protein